MQTTKENIASSLQKITKELEKKNLDKNTILEEFETISNAVQDLKKKRKETETDKPTLPESNCKRARRTFSSFTNFSNVKSP